MSLPINNDFIQKWYGAHPCFRKIMIRQSQAVTSPLSYGILRPVILMPKETDWENTDELQYILEHEYIHIRRFDSSLKLVMIAALCIHWFNPFVWGMYVFINRDIELSCDEGVVRRFGRGAQSAYAMTLIHMEEKRSRLAPLCSGFGKDAVEERVIAVMRMKKVSKISGILAAGLVFCIVSVFATSSGASDVSAITQEDTIRKTVPKNYTAQQEIPDTICYEEYIDGSWWGGILAREGKRRLPGTELYQATFAGDLYERQTKH